VNQFTDLLDLNDEKSYVALLMEEGLSQAEAEDAFRSLRTVYEKYQTTFDSLARKRWASPRHYWILETDSGPRISDSRVMVYDVLDYLNEGVSPTEIAMICNLTLRQVEIALDYIAKHRPTLETELSEIKIRQAAEEAAARAKQQEIAAQALTPLATREQKAPYQPSETDE
jgi:uncharacterized protein (DUF433 family)